jgi:hypothetical protein
LLNIPSPRAEAQTCLPAAALAVVYASGHLVLGDDHCEAGVEVLEWGRPAVLLASTGIHWELPLLLGWAAGRTWEKWR